MTTSTRSALGCALALACAHCGSAASHAQSSDASAPDDGARSDAAPADAGVAVEPVHFIGRFDVTDPVAPRFSWPASALAAHFTGTGLEVALDDPAMDSWFDVTIDHGSPNALALDGGATYTIASNLAPGEHDVLIVKRTESDPVGAVTFKGFTPAGGSIVPTPFPSTRRIEMISDSVTCGNGILGTPPMCPFTAATESENVAWGAVAAQQLGAVHTTIAASGRGILHNGDGTSTDVMPDLWRRTVASDTTPTWDFSRYTPAVVVIFLGSNDYIHLADGGAADPGQAFVTAYTAFIQTVRHAYPDAYIVCSWFGPGPFPQYPFLNTLPGYVASAAKAASDAGDSKVSFFQVPDLVVNDCDAGECGCDGPNVKGHAAIGALLAAYIHGLTGW